LQYIILEKSWKSLTSSIQVSTSWFPLSKRVGSILLWSSNYPKTDLAFISEVCYIQSS